MTALRSRCGHYILVLWFLLLLLSSFFPRLISANEKIGCLPYFHSWCGLSVNLGCRFETYCTRLTGNTGPKKSPKISHLGTITQICLAISSQLRHVLTIGKKFVKQQCLPHTSPQYGELWPTSGWDLLASLRHPSTFQRLSCLGSVTARQSCSGRQPNFAVLNRGRPSRWAFAHIVFFFQQKASRVRQTDAHLKASFPGQPG